MKIVLITPAKLGSQTGNSITANRWAAIFKSLGHSVSILHEFNGGDFDLMVALNAYRSQKSILKFKAQKPECPLAVALTGTDLYKFLKLNKAETLRSIKAADKLVVLSDLAKNVLPQNQHKKVQLIYESAQRLPQNRKPSKRFFNVCVIGHLRPEKDPLLTALAARNLPESSNIRVLHYGKAHSQDWAEKAKKEMTINPRYKWFGEVPHWQIRKALGTCNLMVLSSVLEGGPNSLSEAIIAEVPVLTTNIDGCVGVLGKDYLGYFPVGGEKALQKLLEKTETNPEFLSSLENYILKIAPKFSHEEEVKQWRELLLTLS